MSKLRPEWVSRYPLKQKTNLIELAQKASATGDFDSCADFLVKTISGEQGGKAAVAAAGTILVKITSHIVASKNPTYSDQQLHTAVKFGQQEAVAKEFTKLKQAGLEFNRPGELELNMDDRLLVALTKAISTQLKSNKEISEEFLFQETQQNNLSILREELGEDVFAAMIQQPLDAAEHKDPERAEDEEDIDLAGLNLNPDDLAYLA